MTSDTPSQATWAFGTNDTGEPERNNSSIAHFSEKRDESLIRESIQNSLDAREDKTKPVTVSFQPTTLQPASLSTHSLITTLENCLQGISDQNETHHTQLTTSIEMLQRSSIPALRIRDSNTTGAHDNSQPKGQRSPWLALTKGVGLGDKPRADAAGSWGFGKFAAFANSPVHTVLYTAAWNSFPGSFPEGLRQRHQGKTIQISFTDTKGNNYRATGYLGKGFEPLVDDEIPDEFRMHHPGTTIHVIGYQPSDDWESSSAEIVVRHFFHAILRGGLEVFIGNTNIDSGTITEIAKRCDDRTRRFLNVSQSDPVEAADIEGIGVANLRIAVDPTARTRRREIALVRDAGMMLTDNSRDMNLPGLLRFDARLHSFTAIVECLSEEKQSTLRMCESPEHKRISTDYIEDTSTRKAAQQVLANLGQWVHSSLRKHVDPGMPSNQETAEELTKYLSRPRPSQSDASGQGSLGQELLGEPYQSRRMRRPDNVLVPSAPIDSKKKRKKKNLSNKRRRPTPGTGTQRPGQFNGLRFRPGRQHSTHSVRVTFDNPRQTINNLSLIASGEDDFEIPMGIREAWIGIRKLPVQHGKIKSIPEGISQDPRFTLEFLTREPTVNRSFRLKSGGK